MYANIRDLTHSLQSALKRLEYNRADISVEAKETVDINGCAGDGMRCYYAIVSLDGSIPTEIQYGSWGVDQNQHVIPPGIAVITGTSGGRGNFARVTLHPSNIAALLPAKTEITAEQRNMLESYVSLKPAYRPKYSAESIQALVELGLLKQNKAGATQITTAGKNAVRE
jgi:hypothetical protein